MTDRTRVFVDDDSPIRVEITPNASLVEGERETSSDLVDRIHKIDDAVLFEAYRMIYKVARKTEQLIADLPSAAPDHPHPLANAEIEFGITFEGGVTAAITAKTNATFTVKLTWGK